MGILQNKNIYVEKNSLKKNTLPAGTGCIPDVWGDVWVQTSAVRLAPDVSPTSHQTSGPRRPVPDIQRDVSREISISDVWPRDVFGTSDLGRTADVDETSGPTRPSRRLRRRLHFGRLGMGCIWDVCFRSHTRRRWDVTSQTYGQTSVFRTSRDGMYLGRLFYVAHQTSLRRHVLDVWADVCISDDWGRDVFGTSDLGPTPDVDETSVPRGLPIHLYFGRLGTRCIISCKTMLT